MRAIPEHLGGVFPTRRYTNPRLPYLTFTLLNNLLLCGVSAAVIHRLRMVLNAAVRFVVGAGKFQHITRVLRDVLHWLISSLCRCLLLIL